MKIMPGYLYRLAVSVCFFCSPLLLLSCSSTKVFIEDLKDSNPEVCYKAAAELQKLGPKAKKAMPALIEAAKDSDPFLRRLAIEALGSIGKNTTQTHEVLTSSLRDPDVDVRRAAVVALGKLKYFPSSAFPALSKLLGDEDRLIRELTMSTFEEMGTQVRGTLLRILKDPDPAIRRSAALIIGRTFDEGSDVVIRALKEAINDEDVEVRRLAEEALNRIQPK